MAGTSPDLEINSAVRRVLVRHWIDLGRISIRTQKGKVTLSGILNKLPESDQVLTGAVVENMFGDIRRLHGVQRFTAGLQNWEQTSLGWKLREGPVTATDGGISGHGAGNAPRINMDEWLKRAKEELKAKEDEQKA